MSIDMPPKSPGSGAIAQPRSPSRRRSRTKWTLALLPVAILLAIPAVDFGYSRARPLQRGSVGIGLRVCADPLDDRGCEFRAPRPGEIFVFGFSVRNRSLLPVTITDVDGPHSFFFRVNEVRTYPALGAPPFSGADPFTPFQLQPGEDRILYVAAQFLPCVKPLAIGYSTINDWPITYRLLAASHTDFVRLRGHIRLEGDTNPCLPQAGQPPSP